VYNGRNGKIDYEQNLYGIFDAASERIFLKMSGISCSKCERQGHNLFYVDNTAQVRRGLRGTLGEELRADLVGVLISKNNTLRSGRSVRLTHLTLER